MTASTEIVRTNGAHALLTPDEQVEADRKVANALVRLVEDQSLAKTIQGKKYLTAEAWSVADRILGLSVYIDDPEPITDATGASGYRARAHVRDRDGNLIASASAICSRSETRWAQGKADEYAVMSMAQTRANGKAHRTGLSAIAVMAGYQPTPAEEMPEAAAPAAQAPPAATPLSKKLQEQLKSDAKALGLKPAEIVDALATVTGKKTIESVTHGNAQAVWLAIKAAAHRDPVADGSADEEPETVPDAELDFGAES